MNPNCIAVASMDRDYAGPARVFIYSFKYYHPDIPINIYVLDDYTPDQDILDRYPDIKFIPLKAEKCRKFITDNIDNISKVSFINQAYGPDKIINMFAYLEAIDELIAEKKYDVIIKSDLDTLWCGSIMNDLIEFTKSNLPVAVAREDTPAVYANVTDSYIYKKHIATGGFFCFGIALYNTHILSDNVCDTAFSTMCAGNMSEFVYLDQDALSLSYPEKFELKCIYHASYTSVVSVKDTYIIHYSMPVKPFAVSNVPVIEYHPLHRTYTTYREIAKAIGCSAKFIAQIDDSISKIKKRLVHTRVDPEVLLLRSKCVDTLQKLKESI